MDAINTTGLAQPAIRPAPARAPRLEWISIEQLVVDPAYQRPIKKDGRRAIERIAAEFDWAKFSTVIVAPVSADRYAIIDGQHRTTAAKLCGYDRVPCQILQLSQAEQAASFSAINGNITKVTPWVIYRAALAAGEGWAVEASLVCSKAGCTLMTANKSSDQKKAGEIFAIATIRDLIARRGPQNVTKALEAYRLSPYGDLALAWTNTYLRAWIEAACQNKAAMALTPAQLAAFHEEYDILAADDQVQSRQQQARRLGHPTATRFVLLNEDIATHLSQWLETNAQVFARAHQ